MGGDQLMNESRRESKTVDRRGFAAIDARERVAAKLRVHDVYEGEKLVTELSDDEYHIVRTIAEQPAFANGDPGLRYAAIQALARRLSAENLNLLEDLARFGEDFYVRSHALLALGHAGLYAHIATVAPALDAEERLERSAAARALLEIAARTSLAAVRAHANAVRGAPLVERIDSIVAEHDRSTRTRPAQPQSTAPGKDESGNR
jgi:HEAT repeat protein